MYTDEELIVLLREGDQTAFNELYYRYWKKLYNIIYGKLKSSESSEELVQDLFISLWLKREQLVIHTSFSAYISMAARYLAMKKMQADKVHYTYLNNLDTQELQENSTERVVFLSNLQESFEKEVTNLPDKCRQVFMLSRKDNLSTREIASRLQISEKTVENQIGKALRIMRLRLKEFTTLMALLIIASHP